MWTRILPCVLFTTGHLVAWAGVVEVKDQQNPTNDIHSHSHSRALQSAGVTTLEVMNTVNNTKLMDLFNETIIDLAKIPMAEPSFNIRALVTGSNVRSVSFTLRGETVGGTVKTHKEIRAPYALCGDKGVIYNTCPELGLGRHTVTVASCTRRQRRRCPNGPPYTVTFVILDSRRTKVPAPIVTKAPTKAPTNAPITTSTKDPTKAPVKSITTAPIKPPTKAPTKSPTKPPTKAPTNIDKATTMAPTKVPTKAPTKSPTKAPAKTPTNIDKAAPMAPTKVPTKAPTKSPAKAPTKPPTKEPMNFPVRAPTKVPLNVPVKAPANASVDPCLKDLVSYINCITLSKKTLGNGSSPEEKALQWLALFDSPQPTPDTDVSRRRLRQRFAMLTVAFLPVKNKDGVVSTMKDLFGWPISQPECNWLGGFIFCNNESMVMRLVTTGISSDYIPLAQTTIPPDIGQLTLLTHLEFSFGKFKGTLPTTLGLLTNMRYFGVTYNLLSGTIPTEIASWSALQFAYFEGNDLTGTMPSLRNGFCPGRGSTGNLFADCNAPAKVTCPCCNICY